MLVSLGSFYLSDRLSCMMVYFWVINFLKGPRTLFQAKCVPGSSVVFFEIFCFAMHTRSRHRMRRPLGLPYPWPYCLSLWKKDVRALVCSQCQAWRKMGWKVVRREKTQANAAGKDLVPVIWVLPRLLKGFTCQKHTCLTGSGSSWYPCFTNLSLLELLSAQLLGPKWVPNTKEPSVW